jgi:hypothetical protein
MLRLIESTGQLIDGGLDDITQGSAILSGFSPPSKDLGSRGDFYIDRAAMMFYGPKDISWGTPTNLLGERGFKGEKGDKGDSIRGPQGQRGIDGLEGVPGINGKDGLNGLNGKNGQNSREIELSISKTHFQWRYIGEEWQDLAPLPKNLIGTGGGRWRLSDLFKKLEAGSNITLTKDDANDVIVIASTASGGGSSETFLNLEDSVSLTVADTNTVFTNDGARNLVTAGLPTGALGLVFSFLVTDTTFGFQVQAEDVGDTILVGALESSTGGSATCTLRGGAIKLYGHPGGYIAESSTRSWLVQ